MKKIKTLLLIIAAMTICSCEDYLDIVPDNIATMENAFAMRATTERFLFTCYSWIPPQGGINSNNPGFMSGDELWSIYGFWQGQPWRIARGEQNIVNPLVNYWDGLQGGLEMFRGIRECNIFLENIYSVPDMDMMEKDRWASEVKFLKAYFHFWLLRMYGPIPVIDENLPISAGVEEVKVNRVPVDDCFNYIVNLIDEAMPGLPDKIEARITEAGRIDKSIALSIKAHILVTAASPLFNGNTNYAGFTNEENQPYFNSTGQDEKWAIAANACKKAIDFCDSLGYHLYEFTQGISQTLAPSTITQMSIRNAVCERWNPEIIWGNSNSLMNADRQCYFIPRGLDPNNAGGTSYVGCVAPTLKMAHLFYSKNGVPIEEDKTWDYGKRFELRVAGEEDKLNLIKGYTTASLNFDREDRFYASLGFDGGIWYGQGKYDDLDTWNVQGKLGQPAGIINLEGYSVTGYYPKKLVHYENIVLTNSITTTWYSWPVMRLSNLYLLYAEALNESEGPSEKVISTLDKIRSRAGLKGIEESWTNFSNKPDKYRSKEGMREIIQRERTIELAFEGERYWDLRRWLLAQDELNGVIQGWDVQQKETEAYYRPTVLFEQTFALRDYLWPLRENSLLVNKNLKQNPGW